MASYVLVGDYDASRAQEVVDLLADERFSYAQINATDKEQMKDLIQEHKIDFVMDAAPPFASNYILMLPMKPELIMPIWEPGLFLWRNQHMALVLRTATRNL